jgi:hypothetical protein
MDYSASINDADNPAGASPWGSSPVASPQQPRTNTFPPRDVISPTPYSPNPAGNASYSQEDMSGEGGFNGANNGAEASNYDNGRRPDTAESTQSDVEPQQDFGQHHQHQQQAPAQQQYPAGQHRPEPQRYHHTAARQGQHAQNPHYKLQAKITGLERTGRKDPILRFDVHVRSSHTKHVFLN